MVTSAGPSAFREAWRAVGEDRALVAAEVRSRLVALADSWLGALWGEVAAPADGFALVAVGSLGRRELVPGSDLDLVLVHAGSAKDAARLADAVWYPIWDAKVGLDHSVRTVEEARKVAGEDLRAVLGLLDARHIAGDESLTARLRAGVLEDWRKQARRRLPELRAACDERAAAAGELAFLLEPNLRDARGGLRDLLAIRQVAAAWVVEAPGERVADAGRWLLDVRTELHRQGSRAADRLVMQEHRPVAHALGVEIDVLARRTSQAGRVIAFALDEAWRRVDAAHRSAPRRLTVRRTRGPELRPLADGVVAAGGEVTLTRDADPATDPVLALRTAAAAAQQGLPITPATLQRLVSSADLPEPWPRPAQAAFVALLEAGPPAVPVIEALDQCEIWSRWLPEWELVRFRPQHNPVHRFTVDRHLVETATGAAALARGVERPDLLVLGGLLHDIGKGVPDEDHTDAGVRLAPAILRRMGVAPEDIETVTMLVQHHLLLPETATRRDPEDPATLALVVDAAGTHERLDLLHALTEADALAAGPAAWTPWKAGLVATLVSRAHAAIGGSAVPLDPEPMLTDAARLLAATGQIDAAIDAGPAAARVTVVAPDTSGLLWRWAAVMALHRLEILAATATHTPGVGGRTMAVTVFEVRSRFGDLPDITVLRQDLRRVVDDPSTVEARVAGRERSARQDVWSRLVAPPRVLWFDDESAHATIVEIRAHDSAGLLSRLARVLAEADLDVSRARIQTLGAEVVDAFYVTGPGGTPVTDPGVRGALEPRLIAACEPAT